MDFTTPLIILATLVVSWIIKKILFRLKYNLPPGPWSLPLVGHLPKLGADRHLYLQHLADKYGNVFSFYLGTRLTVVVSDYEVLKEIASKEEFLGRPPQVFEFNKENPHMGEMNGPEWKEQRRFMLSTLRELGMGKKSGENAVTVQVTSFLDALRSSKGQTMNIRQALTPVTNNIIFNMMADRQFDVREPMAQIVNRFQSEVMDFMDQRTAQYYYPYLKHVLPFLNKTIKSGIKVIKEFEDALELETQEHEKIYQDDFKRDFIDYYLAEIQRNELKTFTRETLLGNATILMIAGAETIKTALEWCYINMASFPHVQEKVFREIVQIVGHERLPEWSDRSNLPYTRATLLEVWRWSNVFGVNDPRMVTEDTKIGRYDIPKGTTLLMLFYSVHMNRETWGDPEVFKPERFLTDEGKKLDNEKAERVLTFSLGKRSCPGETLGKTNVFLYFAAVVQRFRILPPSEGLDTGIKKSITNTIQNPLLYFLPR